MTRHYLLVLWSGEGRATSLFYKRNNTFLHIKRKRRRRETDGVSLNFTTVCALHRINQPRACSNIPHLVCQYTRVPCWRQHHDIACWQISSAIKYRNETFISMDVRKRTSEYLQSAHTQRSQSLCMMRKLNRLPKGHDSHFHLQVYSIHKKEYLLTYSMVQSPSWEANWFAASQEIPRILWNPMVH